MRKADREKVLIKVQEKCDPAQDPEELVGQAEEFFLSETWRPYVPDKAFWVWVSLAVAMGKPESEAAGQVSSVKRGDTTISYESRSESVNAVPGLMERVHGFRVGRRK